MSENENDYGWQGYYDDLKNIWQLQNFPAHARILPSDFAASSRVAANNRRRLPFPDFCAGDRRGRSLEPSQVKNTRWGPPPPPRPPVQVQQRFITSHLGKGFRDQVNNRYQHDVDDGERERSRTRSPSRVRSLSPEAKPEATRPNINQGVLQQELALVDKSQAEAPRGTQESTIKQGEKRGLTKSERIAILARPEKAAVRAGLQKTFDQAVKNTKEIGSKQKSTLARTCGKVRREVGGSKAPYDKVAAEASGVSASAATYEAFKDIQKFCSAQVEVVAACKAAFKRLPTQLWRVQRSR